MILFEVRWEQSVKKMNEYAERAGIAPMNAAMLESSRLLAKTYYMLGARDYANQPITDNP
jgi:hypothetical protein